MVLSNLMPESKVSTSFAVQPQRTFLPPLLYNGSGGQCGPMATFVEQTASQPELHQTPTGWLAIGNDYPRIGVTAPTEAEAVEAYRKARAEWRALSDD